MSERAVIVGVGQMRRRPGLDGDWQPLEPSRMVAQCLEAAAADAGRPELVAEADAVGWIPAVAWAYADPGAAVAAALGRPAPRVSWSCKAGGESGVQVVNDAALRIAAGEIEIALVGGCEALYSRSRARKEGVELGWTPGGEDIRHLFAGQRPFANESERRHGVALPIYAYPMLENAIRAEAGRSIADHQHYLAKLYARFSEVAAANPYSWFPEKRTAADIESTGEANRMVGFPYPKRMNAIMEVDQAAAALVMSAAAADRLGIAPSRRVTVLGGGRSVDGWSISERARLTSSPAYEAAARATMQHAAIGPADVDVFDFYSCFPAVVQFAMRALDLGIDDPRGFTRTGGLAHHGGPGNAYSMHGVANVVNALRAGRGRVGWVSGLGMTATKHAIVALSTDPARVAASDGGVSEIELPVELRDGPALVERPEGPAVIESYTVAFDRSNQPERSIVLLRLEDGRRALANGRHTPEELRALTGSEGVGLRGRVTPGAADAPNVFALGG
jgi:acetyl-CoA C-acetyltransferase